MGVIDAAPIGSFEKDPTSVQSFSIDWSPWLGVDTIASSSWEASDPGITIDHDDKTNTSTTVWLTGGTAGQYYDLHNTVLTAGGRTDKRTIRIYVANL